MHRDGRLHALTWAWWAVAGVVVLQLAPNPTYVAVVLVVTALVVEVHAVDGPLRAAFPLVVGLAVAAAVVRVVLTALTTHGCLSPGDAACTQVLVRLPEIGLPTLLGGFTLGGTVELPIVLRAASDAFVVVGVVAVFAAFNSVVSHHQLVRLAPRAFHELGLIVTVALAFVPATLATVAAVREADRARTGGVRRGRLRRLVVPVFETGMERALRLAESMDARGFGHLEPSASERAAGWAAGAGLAALAAAFVALIGGHAGLALGVAAAGSVTIGTSVVVASRATGRPRYRATRPTRTDLVLAVAVAAAPVGVALWVAWGDVARTWQVEANALPPFDLRLALPIVLLAAPIAYPSGTSLTRAVATRPASEP